MGITQTLELALQDIIQSQVASCLNERLTNLIRTEVIQEWAIREADLISNDRVLAQRMDHLEKHLGGLDDRHEADHQNLDLRIKAAIEGHTKDVESLWNNIGKLATDLEELKRYALALTTSSPTPYTVPEEVRSLDERVTNLESEMVTVRNNQEHLSNRIETNYRSQSASLAGLTNQTSQMFVKTRETIKNLWEDEIEPQIDKKIEDHWEAALDGQDLADTIANSIDDKVERTLESGSMLTNVVRTVIKSELEFRIVIE